MWSIVENLTEEDILDVWRNITLTQYGCPV
uniref:Uncharacterized protein n=1 Tax=Anguilla anguilla TaxID=7936 RepID=A0A0E9RUS0_ANGAN